METRSKYISWGGKIGLVMLAILWLMLVASTWADADEGNASVAPGDEYSFKWLDPDKRIYVLQNRRFTKANHLTATLLGGIGLSNPYRSSFQVAPRATYYINETLGIEFFYSKEFNRQNNTYQAFLLSGSQTRPAVREIRSEYGAMMQWVPWYAKINFFNQILYFDWYLSGGAGSLSSSVGVKPDGSDFINQDHLGLYWGTGHIYHLSQSFALRLDLTGAYFQAYNQGSTGAKVWYSNYNFGLGFGLSL